jgi:uncharacterized membrane protein YfcA
MSPVWLLVALFMAGAFAALIDGALGMGFGVTNTSLLLTLGLAPAAASASVHAAEMATSLASGTAHLRLGNVDKSALLWLVAPGCVGGAMGAYFLAGADPTSTRAAVSVFLLLMGALILVRFFRRPSQRPRRTSRARTGGIGFVAATLDAFGGGGWGPIATPGLILAEGKEPRKAVGTVNLAEFFITCSITATFIFVLGPQAIRWDFVAAVAAGGVLCAPVGAYLARRVRAPLLAGAVGALLLGLNIRIIAVDFMGADARTAALAMVLLLAALLSAVAFTSRRQLGPAVRPTPIVRPPHTPHIEFRVEKEWRAY